MHGDLSLNGWLIYAIYAIGILSILGAAAITVDSYRRPRTHFGALGKAPWIAIQFAYLVMAIAGMLASLGAAFTAALGVLAIAALVQQVAYLLRVVYPTPARLEARKAAESESVEAAGGEENAGS